ncbi:hypothetical protein [Thalassobellus citreus]|uniref:hypothetical protein n=1 Tax=Thalassobellus citreus TaxID=3367752 RepID=UPI0037AC2441
MPKNSEELQDQKEQALAVLNELLCYLQAKDYRERINDLFYAFLLTEEADYKEQRTNLMHTHFELTKFFTKLHGLPLVDKCRN